MSPWLFNVYMDGVVREVNVRVLGKGLELLSANGGRFEINQLFISNRETTQTNKPPKHYTKTGGQNISSSLKKERKHTQWVRAHIRVQV